jgi:UDP-N-acetyl-2-amino-2-deoxyglucuronate dehydrogenase
MKNFALTGIAGYIAPRHLQAIKDTGNNLVAAVDPHDSVGILDKYFPNASFFTEIERFDRHLEKLRKHSQNEAIHYLSVCSPNHLHDAHIRLAFRLHADAICEKPLVIKPSNLDALQELELEYGKKVLNVLQLRTHEKIIELKKNIQSSGSNKKHDVTLTYITSR